MRTAAANFSTTTNATTPILVPGRVRLRGVQLAGRLDPSVGNSSAFLQVSTSGQAKNSSTDGMSGVFGMIQLQSWNAAVFCAAVAIYIPLDIIVDQRVFLHASITNGSTGEFTAVIYFD